MQALFIVITDNNTVLLDLASSMTISCNRPRWCTEVVFTQRHRRRVDSDQRLTIRVLVRPCYHLSPRVVVRHASHRWMTVSPSSEVHPRAPCNTVLRGGRTHLRGSVCCVRSGEGCNRRLARGRRACRHHPPPPDHNLVHFNADLSLFNSSKYPPLSLKVTVKLHLIHRLCWKQILRVLITHNFFLASFEFIELFLNFSVLTKLHRAVELGVYVVAQTAQGSTKQG